MLRFANFLDQTSQEELYEYACREEARFEPVGVDTRMPEYRVARLLYSFEPWQTRFRNLIIERVSDWGKQLGVPEFETDRIDLQLTVHTHGGYFKAHYDEGIGFNRSLSVVYYFHKTPKSYQGGELYIYKGRAATQVEHIVVPENNLLVVFRSDLLHGVQRVWNAATHAEGRFTINGWVVRKPSNP